MKRNKPKQQRHERAHKRKQLKDAYSGEWFSVRVREISDIVVSNYFDALSDIMGLTCGESTDVLAPGIRLGRIASASSVLRADGRMEQEVVKSALCDVSHKSAQPTPNPVPATSVADTETAEKF